MAHVQTNINKFYSKLQEFWNIERYTDVTIECGNKSFKCHKLALATTCEYFDSMFGGSFKEKTMEMIMLKDIAAETFEEVLKFIYTGDLVITSYNVLSLLQASEFFNLPGIEDLCIQFFEKNKFTFQNVFDVFAFACLTKKNTIIDMCASFFQRWFEILTKDEKFYDIPFDSLKIILIEFSKLSKKNENSLLNGILQWIQHDRFSRFQYSNELFEMINFNNISSSKLQFMCERLLLYANVNILAHRTESLNQNAVLKCDTTSGGPKVGLHLFVNDPEENMKRIISMDGNRLCPSACETVQNKNAWTRCVAVDDFYLYELSFFERGSSIPYTWQNKFCVYSSIDMCSEIQLKPPPVNFYGKRTATCAIQNNIYVYHPYSFTISNVGCQAFKNTNASNSFSDEEISRGIYAYNCHTDAWFSVPKMRKNLDRSCMSVCHDTLYVIGGDRRTQCESGVARYAQAYDYREGIWRQLPRSNSVYVAAASCAIGDKVYVCGGTQDSGTQLERYDTIAGKWEKLAPMSFSLSFHQVLAYMNQLWAMGCIFKDSGHIRSYFKNPFIKVYDPSTDNWRNFEGTSEGNVQYGCIMDAVVFKFP